MTDAFVAVDDAAAGFTTSPFRIDPRANDAGPEGVALSIGAVSTLSGGGVVTIAADGALLFEPDDAFDGLAPGETATVTFSYVLGAPNRGAIDVSALTPEGGFAFQSTGPNYSFEVAEPLGTGDVNGDGVDDLILGDRFGGFGAPYLAVLFGREGLREGPVDLYGLGPEDGLHVTGSFGGGEYIDEPAFAAVGDLDGDGVTELALASRYSGDATPAVDSFGYTQSINSGLAAVLFGVSGRSGTVAIDDAPGGPETAVLVPDAPIGLGGGVFAAGDLNGDGYDDLGVTSNGYFFGEWTADLAALHVVFGGPAGAAALATPGALDGANGFTIPVLVSEGAGYQGDIATGLDMNGDGVDDLVLSAYVDGEFVVAVVYGRADGFDATVTLEALSGDDGYLIAAGPGVVYEFEVVALGDANGDGRDDLGLVYTELELSDCCASQAGPPQLAVLYGGASPATGRVTLAERLAAGSRLITNAWLDDGYARLNAAPAGDFNNDGLADLLISTYDQSYDPDTSDFTERLEAYVVFGVAGVDPPPLSLQDIDGANGVALIGVTGFTYQPSQARPVGDLNADGFDDIVIIDRVPNPDDPFGVPTTAAVVYGRAAGPAPATGTVTVTLTAPEALALAGDDGPDDFAGGAGRDTLSGGLGDDTLTGGLGDDALDGGAGDDSLSGDADEDVLSGGDGDDALSGGDGDDTLLAGLGDDTADGGDGDDFILAGDGDDTVTAGAGDDIVKLGRGDDVLDAGDGDDNVFGFRGNERLVGGAGHDSMRGNHGDDTFEGGAGDDVFILGPGRDVIVYNDLDWGRDRAPRFNVGSDLIDLSGAGITGIDALDIFQNGRLVTIWQSDSFENSLSMLIEGGERLTEVVDSVFIFA